MSKYEKSNKSHLSASIIAEENINRISTSLNININSNNNSCAPLSASQITLARKYEEEMKAREDAAKQNKQQQYQSEQVARGTSVKMNTSANTILSSNGGTNKVLMPFSRNSSSNHTTSINNSCDGPLAEIAKVEEKLKKQKIMNSSVNKSTHTNTTSSTNTNTIIIIDTDDNNNSNVVP